MNIKKKCFHFTAVYQLVPVVVHIAQKMPSACLIMLTRFHTVRVLLDSWEMEFEHANQFLRHAIFVITVAYTLRVLQIISWLKYKQKKTILLKKNTCYNRDPTLYECICNIGYYGDGFICEPDVNCQNVPSLCHPNAECASTTSGLQCVCNAGKQNIMILYILLKIL